MMIKLNDIRGPEDPHVPMAPWWPPRFLMLRLQLRYQIGPWLVRNRENLNSGALHIEMRWTGLRWVIRYWPKELAK